MRSFPSSILCCVLNACERMPLSAQIRAQIRASTGLFAFWTIAELLVPLHRYVAISLRKAQHPATDQRLKGPATVPVRVHWHTRWASIWVRLSVCERQCSGNLYSGGRSQVHPQRSGYMRIGRNGRLPMLT